MGKHSKLDAQNPPFWDREKLKSLFCGLVAGLSSRTLVAPFERAIIIKQTNLSQYSGNTFTLLANIYAKEGLPGFFRGNAANCFRVAPTTAIEFFLFDIFKQQFEPYDNLNSTARYLISGALSGVIACASVYPIDVVKTMHSLGLYQNRSVFQTFTDLLREKGARSLYRGLFATAMVSLGSYLGNHAVLRIEAGRVPNLDKLVLQTRVDEAV